MESIIHKTKTDIDKSLEEGLTRLVNRGNVRGLEIFWKNAVKEKYQTDAKNFNGRDIGNLKTLIGEYAHVKQLIMFAVERWQSVRMQENLRFLSPLPVFNEFFIHREKINALLAKEKQKKLQLDLKEEQNGGETPLPQGGGRRLSFREMVQAEVRKNHQLSANNKNSDISE